jgi:hypothetical protein
VLEDQPALLVMEEAEPVRVLRALEGVGEIGGASVSQHRRVRGVECARHAAVEVSHGLVQGFDGDGGVGARLDHLVDLALESSTQEQGARGLGCEVVDLLEEMAMVEERAYPDAAGLRGLGAFSGGAEGLGEVGELLELLEDGHQLLRARVGDEGDGDEAGALFLGRRVGVGELHVGMARDVLGDGRAEALLEIEPELRYAEVLGEGVLRETAHDRSGARVAYEGSEPELIHDGGRVTAR